MSDFGPIKFVAHDAAGNIIRTGEVPRYALAAQQFDAAGVVEGEGGIETHYVDNGVIVAKAPSPVVMAGDVFTNVPPDSWATVDAARYDLTDTTAEFTFDLPGTYVVTVCSVRYLPITHTITVA